MALYLLFKFKQIYPKGGPRDLVAVSHDLDRLKRTARDDAIRDCLECDSDILDTEELQIFDPETYDIWSLDLHAMHHNGQMPEWRWTARADWIRVE